MQFWNKYRKKIKLRVQSTVDVIETTQESKKKDLIHEYTISLFRFADDVQTKTGSEDKWDFRQILKT